MVPDQDTQQLLAQADRLTHQPTFQSLPIPIRATVCSFVQNMKRLTAPPIPTPNPEAGFYEPHHD